MAESDVVGFDQIDRAQVALVGGKGASLGELVGIEGVRVPPGFCVTTAAYQRAVEAALGIDELIDRLSPLDPGDRGAIAVASAAVRRAVEAVDLPEDLVAAITVAVEALGEHVAYAVRSSATAEDLPTASFAGQHDSYLHVLGAPAIVEHVRRCWASLFTERAVAYRLRNGVDHRQVRMAVVVQQLADAQASGVLFTADPVTGDRTVTAVEATFGLGEALVSGLVEADSYRVRAGQVVAATIGAKQIATRVRPEGEAPECAVDPERGGQAALTVGQVLELAALGRRIEAHLGVPQDVEWCRGDDGFEIVQSRPITTLFPIPEAGDGANHVYLSVGHQQMMTDPMKPLGLDLWRRIARPPMVEAAGRLYVDVTAVLAAPASRDPFVRSWIETDPLIGDALQTIVDRDGFLPEAPAARVGGAPPVDPPAPIETDGAIVTDLIARTEASIAAAAQAISAMTGPALLAFVLDDIQELQRVLWDPRTMQVVLAGMDAAAWLDDHLAHWLDEKDAADTLTRSVPHNVTSEMGLALLDVADAIRPHPEVVARLRQVTDDGFLDELPGVAGGAEARAAIEAFLDRYGMRGVGEIDLTRPRWSERPSTLLPLILGNVGHVEPGEGARRFEQGRREAAVKEREVLERLRALPDGEQKAAETKAVIDRVRAFAGFREYPKYGIVRRLFVYKQALLVEFDRLAAAGLLGRPDDACFLSFAELQEVAAGTPVDGELVAERRAAHAAHGALTPPRVLTSDGEAVAGSYRRRDVPAGALVGLGVSTGTVEGRARVVHDLVDADLGPGDILVTTYTDPSWSLLFVAVAGLVTEVGGLMTHGSVIAREYGLPAVVGVEGATRRIRDGQRIRVHGRDGLVEVLSS